MPLKSLKVSTTRFTKMINSDKKIELLAPAKDKNTAIAAINAGADAVYIGFLKFGARKAAGNSLQDIAEIVKYADIYRANVYVTLNTIYKDEEIPEVIKTLKDLYKIGVSAIIIQDMGILDFDLPPIKIFASTQCHNYTLERIKFLEKIGINRVILPREFSLEQIKNISENTKIDIETFIHGALCVSYSGQCYLSYAIGGRSANRGECAQPCRKKYSLEDGNGKLLAKEKYLLSLKDFNLSEKIKDLILSGVSSFKIEGRLKDEEYVRNVVSYYRQKIDEVLKELKFSKSSQGTSYPTFEPDVYKSFNRSFTDFFIDGKRKNICTYNYTKSLGEYIGKVLSVDKNSISINGKTLNNGDGICFFDENDELCGTQVQKSQNNKIFLLSTKSIKKGTKIYRNSDIEFDKKVMSKDIARKIQISANFEMSNSNIKFTLKDFEGNTAETTLAEPFELAENKEKAINNIKNNLSKLGNTEFEIDNINIYSDDIFFIPIKTLNELRRETVEKLQSEREKNFTREKRTTKISTAEYPEKILDYKANIYNKYAKDFYEKCGAKVIEPAAEAQKDLSKKTLMTSKHCIKYTLGLCKKYFPNGKNYKEPLMLIDEKNKKYILTFDCKNCIMHVENL